MLEFFTLLRNYMLAIIAEIDKHPLQIGNFRVSLFALIFAFLVISIVVSVFWKGAKV